MARIMLILLFHKDNNKQYIKSPGIILKIQNIRAKLQLHKIIECITTQPQLPLKIAVMATVMLILLFHKGNSSINNTLKVQELS